MVPFLWSPLIWSGIRTFGRFRNGCKQEQDPIRHHGTHDFTIHKQLQITCVGEHSLTTNFSAMLFDFRRSDPCVLDVPVTDAWLFCCSAKWPEPQDPQPSRTLKPASLSPVKRKTRKQEWGSWKGRSPGLQKQVPTEDVRRTGLTAWQVLKIFGNPHLNGLLKTVGPTSSWGD